MALAKEKADVAKRARVLLFGENKGSPKSSTSLVAVVNKRIRSRSLLFRFSGAGAVQAGLLEQRPALKKGGKPRRELAGFLL